MERSVWIADNEYRLAGSDRAPRPIVREPYDVQSVEAPSIVRELVWRLDGPIGASRGNYGERLLRPEYATLECRYEHLLTSLAERNALDLSTDSALTNKPPTTHVSSTNWTEVGNANGQAHDELNSYDSPNDATYWHTSTDASAFLTVGVGALTDPGTDDLHSVLARVIAPATNTAQMTGRLRLFDGATAIGSFNFTIDVPGVVYSRAWETYINPSGNPNVTCGSGSNRMLLVVVATEDNTGDNTDLTALTFNGQAMTQVVQQVSDNGVRANRIEIWRLLEASLPAGGTTAALVPTWSNGAPDFDVIFSTATYSGVHQTTPIGETGSQAVQNGTQVSVSGISLDIGDYGVIAAITGQADATNWTPISGYTETVDQAATSSRIGIAHKLMTAAESGAITQTLNITGNRLIGVALEINPDGTDRATSVSWAVSSSLIASLSGYASVRIGIAAVALNGGTMRVSEMALRYPEATTGNVVTIDEDRGQIFVQRGQESTQVDPGTMLEVDTVDHGFNVTDSVDNWHGEGFVCFGQALVMQKRTAVNAAGATYSGVTTQDAYKAVIGADRLWIVDANGGADDGKVKFAVNDVTASTDFSNALQVADPGGTVTGLYTVGPYLIVGHERGANSFTSAGDAERLLEAVKQFPSPINGAAGDSIWGWHYNATKLGLYAINVSFGIANPVGPAEGLQGTLFEGPIDGYPTAVKAWKDSLWVSYLDTLGDSWILRGVFGSETAETGRPDWYFFTRLSGTECHSIGATTGRTNPTLILAEGSDVAWYTMGRRGRDIADANYRFSVAGGEWFGQTAHVEPSIVKNIRSAYVVSENCDANNTWQLAVSIDGGAYVDIGSAITTNGRQDLLPVSAGKPLLSVSGHTIKPRLTQVAASATAPPQIRGPLTIVYDVRPERSERLRVPLEVTRYQYDTLKDLTLHGQAAPVAVRIPGQEDFTADQYAVIRGVGLTDEPQGNQEVLNAIVDMDIYYVSVTHG